MQSRDKEFIIPLTEIDRAAVRFGRRGRTVTDFSVQYEALIGGEWRKIVRYDSAHGAPHRHNFRPNGSEVWSLFPYYPHNLALDEALARVKKGFGGMRASYLQHMKRGKDE